MLTEDPVAAVAHDVQPLQLSQVLASIKTSNDQANPTTAVPLHDSAADTAAAAAAAAATPTDKPDPAAVSTPEGDAADIVVRLSIIITSYTHVLCPVFQSALYALTVFQEAFADSSGAPAVSVVDPESDTTSRYEVCTPSHVLFTLARAVSS